MKYKLLNQKGMCFLCLEDGTKIPCQVKSVFQIMRKEPIVTIEALCDNRLGSPDDPKLKLTDNVLTYGRYFLDNVSNVVFRPGTPGPEGEMGNISFTVACELPDTTEQPKHYEV